MISNVKQPSPLGGMGSECYFFDKAVIRQTGKWDWQVHPGERFVMALFCGASESLDCSF